MKNAHRIVAWVCIFSTLFVGCYSSVIIDPNSEVEGEGKGKVDPETIEYVVTKTDRKYIFVTPPTIVNDTILGVGKIKGVSYWDYTMEQVQLPMSDVAEVCVSEFNTWSPLYFVVVVGGTLLFLSWVGWFHS